jgi:hypothetical protein
VADDLETAIAAGAVTALRRRAARQTELARLGTVESDKTAGVSIPHRGGGARRSPSERVGRAGSGNGGRAMSTLKTPDNATLPKPNLSRGRELRRQEARRRPGQAKDRTMPKKPKPEREVDEPKKPYQTTPAEKEAVRRILAHRQGRSSAPQVSIRHESGTAAISLKQGDSIVASAVFMDALGICEEDFASWYLSQIIEVARPGARADEKATNAMLAGIAAMRPRDETEAMLIAQMIATHELAMTFARRLKHIENIPQQDSAVNGLTKLTRTYAAQMEALKRYRSGGEQKMTVQHVHVAEGGQAIVGNVNAPTRG